MKYASGKTAKLGDRVSLGSDQTGVVVCVFDTEDYATGFPEAEWNHLSLGILIQFETYGLIHYEKTEPDLQLLERAHKAGKTGLS